jgi:hypothetical protein
MKWYSKLSLAKDERTLPAQPPSPSFLKAGRVKRTWDTVFIEYQTLLKANLLIAVFFIPFILFLTYVAGLAEAASKSFEYALNTGIGYPIAVVENLGKTIELVSTIRENLIFAFLLLLIPGPFFSGIYNVVRLLAWGHTGSSIKILRVFFDGVKKHWWKYAVIYTGFTAVLFGAVYFGFYHYENVLRGGAALGGWFILAGLAVVVLTALSFTAYCFSMIPSYSLKFGEILKNGALYTVGIYPVNIFVCAVSSVPFLILLTGSAVAVLIAAAIVFFLLMSMYALIFTSFCGYGFENFLDKLYASQAAERAKPASNTGKKKDKKTANVYSNPKKSKKQNG